MSRKKKKRFGVRQDYHRRRLQNPFFRERKGRDRPWSVILVLSILILVIFLWFFLSASLWRIKTIKINGLTRLPASDIENYVFSQEAKGRLFILKQNNIFLLDKEELSQELLTKYNFSGLKIKKSLPSTIEIIIKERPYAFIFQQGNQYYYSSSDAYLFKDIPVSDEDKGKYFILENRNKNDLIGNGDRIRIKDEYLKFSIELNKELENYDDLSLDRFIIDQEFNTIKAALKDGPIILFNTRSGVAQQVKRLALVKSEKIKDNFNRVDYIDLRYGDRVFYLPPSN